VALNEKDGDVGEGGRERESLPDITEIVGESEERTVAKSAIRSACTAVEIESPLPSASDAKKKDRHPTENEEKRLTWITGLTNFPTPPVEIVAFLTYPVARLMFNGSTVTSVQNGRMLQGYRNGWSDLTRVRKRLVEAPEHEARR
jgi:hypothetical protein